MPIFYRIFYSVPMDKDLALAVLNSFQTGERVHDTMLYKAASSLGAKKEEVLKEARLKTAATSFIKRAQRMNQKELQYFSSACGYSPSDVVKIAKLTDSSPEEVIFTYLSAVNFIPHEKFAEGEQPQGQTLQQDPSLLGNPQLPQGALTSQDMMGNLMYQPSPTAPTQLPITDKGNMEQLVQNFNNKNQIQAEQEQAAAEQTLQQNPQPQLPKEQVEQALMSASPEEKMKYVFPGASPQEMQRAVEALANVEQQTGLTVSDVGQLTKIVQEIKKENKKVIDDSIKMQFGAGENEQALGPLPGTPGNDSQRTQDISPEIQKIARKIRCR